MPPEAQTPSVGPFLWGDPPQRDETWLSYLSRTAQYLGMSVGGLVESTTGEKWQRQDDLDIDRNPYSRGATKLRALISLNDQADMLSRRRIQEHLVGKSSRMQYCPLCAKADLEQSRTPYFRWQWSTPFSLVCHDHDALLMTWQPSANSAVLKWPGAWLSSANERPLPFPAWLQRDLDHIDSVSRLDSSLQEVAAVLQKVQRHFLGHECTYVKNEGQVPDESVTRWLWDVIRLAAVAHKGSELPPLADRLRPEEAPDWLLGRWRERHQRRHYTDAMKTFLVSRDLPWRRSVLWLAGRLIFGSSQPVKTSLGDLPPGNWEHVWEEWVIPTLAPEAAFYGTNLLDCLKLSVSHSA